MRTQTLSLRGVLSFRYNVLVVFVLLNVFIGIIGEAYGAAKEPFSGELKDDIAILCKVCEPSH